MQKKTAIITGGSRGIGFAAAKRLAADGFNIVVFSTREGPRWDMYPPAAEDSFLAVAGSLSVSADRERLVRETVARFGRVDVLVNNAGVAPKERRDLLDMTEESWDEVLGTNTKGTMFLTQLVARQMIAQSPVEPESSAAAKKRGTVINISSCSADTSSVTRGEYCVSKAGIAMLTLLYADRLAREGIFVHEIRPGVIETDMTATVRGKYDALIDGGLFPIARWGVPDDIAAAVSVFAGDAFLYTTGNYVDVDGGFHIKRL